MPALASAITTATITPVGDRERLAVRIFRFAVAANLALTVFAATGNALVCWAFGLWVMN